MKTIVVYDSQYGNTESIAKSIGSAFDVGIRVVNVGELNPNEITPTDLLIIGSPTHGGRPTPAIQKLIEGISEQAMKGTYVAAFDTRFSSRMVRIFGYAAERIANNLETKGGKLVSPPEAFFVVGKKGPLKEGEVERAANWGKEISDNLSSKQ